jgi:diacylglycerol kinase
LFREGGNAILSLMVDLRKLKKAFQCAFAGIGHALRSQQNFKIHLSIAFLTIVAGAFLKITILEWIALTFSIFFVLVTEMINTAFEEMVNLMKCEYDQHCRIAKDVAAGMVLFASIAAVIVGFFVFLPRFLSLLLE